MGKCVFVSEDDDFVFGGGEGAEVGVVGMEDLRDELFVAEVDWDVGEANAWGAGL